MNLSVFVVVVLVSLGSVYKPTVAKKRENFVDVFLLRSRCVNGSLRLASISEVLLGPKSHSVKRIKNSFVFFFVSVFVLAFVFVFLSFCHCVFSMCQWSGEAPAGRPGVRAGPRIACSDVPAASPGQ